MAGALKLRLRQGLSNGPGADVAMLTANVPLLSIDRAAELRVSEKLVDMARGKDIEHFVLAGARLFKASTPEAALSLRLGVALQAGADGACWLTHSLTR